MPNLPIIASALTADAIILLVVAAMMPMVFIALLLLLPEKYRALGPGARWQKNREQNSLPITAMILGKWTNEPVGLANNPRYYQYKLRIAEDQGETYLAEAEFGLYCRAKIGDHLHLMRRGEKDQIYLWAERGENSALLHVIAEPEPIRIPSPDEADTPAIELDPRSITSVRAHKVDGPHEPITSITIMASDHRPIQIACDHPAFYDIRTQLDTHCPGIQANLLNWQMDDRPHTKTERVLWQFES